MYPQRGFSLRHPLRNAATPLLIGGRPAGSEKVAPSCERGAGASAETLRGSCPGGGLARSLVGNRRMEGGEDGPVGPVQAWLGLARRSTATSCRSTENSKKVVKVVRPSSKTRPQTPAGRSSITVAATGRRSCPTLRNPHHRWSAVCVPRSGTPHHQDRAEYPGRARAPRLPARHQDHRQGDEGPKGLLHLQRHEFQRVTGTTP